MISNSCCSISRTKFGANVRSVMAEICAPKFDFNLFFLSGSFHLKTGGGFSFDLNQGPRKIRRQDINSYCCGRVHSTTSSAMASSAGGMAERRSSRAAKDPNSSLNCPRSEHGILRNRK